MKPHSHPSDPRLNAFGDGAPSTRRSYSEPTRTSTPPHSAPVSSRWVRTCSGLPGNVRRALTVSPHTSHTTSIQG